MSLRLRRSTAKEDPDADLGYLSPGERLGRIERNILIDTWLIAGLVGYHILMDPDFARIVGAIKSFI